MSAIRTLLLDAESYCIARVDPFRVVSHGRDRMSSGRNSARIPTEAERIVRPRILAGPIDIQFHFCDGTTSILRLALDLYRTGNIRTICRRSDHDSGNTGNVPIGRGTVEFLACTLKFFKRVHPPVPGERFAVEVG